MHARPCTLVFDVGKTHAKLHVIDAQFTSCWSRQIRTAVVDAAPYPHIDTDGLWQWFIASANSAAEKYPIDAVCVTTHGATAALIDEKGLVLPVLDYEYGGVESINAAYAEVRPSFSASGSPALPAGLNLGRQLFWLQRQFPREFAEASHILMFPQYWAWRLSGELASEVSSLGCHTDLWKPLAGDYTCLVDQQGWRSRFPPLKAAFACLGMLHSEVVRQTGLPSNCRVYTGVHDSNANYLRYLATGSVVDQSQSFAVISTGTWTITLGHGVDIDAIDASRDMLVNVDIHGQPIACARFMGGREYETICALTGAPIDTVVTESMLQALIDKGIYALPDFSGGFGPFAGHEQRIAGTTRHGAALAALYCALLMDYELELLAIAGAIFIEGAFTANPVLCSVLAQLCEGHAVYSSTEAAGSAQGCALLAQWPPEDYLLGLNSVAAAQLTGLGEYKMRWRKQMSDYKCT